MKLLAHILNTIVLVILAYFCSVTSLLYGQQAGNTFLKGVVSDIKTGEPVPYAVVVIEGTTDGTSTDSEGRFSLNTNALNIIIKTSCLGYIPEIIRIAKTSSNSSLSIKLTPSSTSLREVVIKAERVKYRNKANPAVQLIEKVIENKELNRPENYEFLQYEKYEKTQFAITNISEQLKEGKALRKVRFIFDNIDTAKYPGKEILPIYIKESLFDCYYRKSPKASSEIVKADKMLDFEGYLNNEGITGYLKYLYQNVNIYDNNVLFLTNIFLSPIAKSAPSFYRYYIMDTTDIGGSRCIKLFFSPRNKTDMLFQGYLYITLDKMYAVKKADMSVNRKINLNWVNDAWIVQEFDNGNGEGWLISFDEVSIDFGITRNGLGVFGQRSLSYKNYILGGSPPDSIFKTKTILMAADSSQRTEEYWELNRHQELTKSERGIYATVDSLKHVPAFMRTMDIMRILIASFHDFGKFEIGPVITFYSYNPIEGSKVRFGGRTTPKFSKKINFDGYLAYGFGDRKVKYNIGTTYSFTNKTIHEFPVKSLRVSYQSDTKIPGQELYFVQEGNALLSLKRGVDDKLFYNNTFKIEYLHEFLNHFSYSLLYNFTHQSAGGSLKFKELDISEVGMTLRYAPHEEFYQGKIYRAPVANKYPVLQLRYTYGSKVLGNDYEYHNLRLNFYKRFYPSMLGYTTITLDAGKIFGKVPYPLLQIHNANQTYIYQSTAYNLMNFLEFVSDQYVSVNLDHCFNGFLFNKIPLINRLGLREIVTVKVLYGSLSKKNNPNINPNLFQFPTDSQGDPVTFALGTKPYAEVSVGISNIFKILRVDFVKRLTYHDNPNVTDKGVRIRFKFDL